MGFVYDYGSMMHYSATAGSVYWLLPTMTTKDPAYVNKKINRQEIVGN